MTVIQPMDWKCECLQPCSLEEVERLLDQRLVALGSEVIDVSSASGRVLATSLSSEYAVPPFNRAAKDGYAVRSTDTATASEVTPVRLDVIGQSLPNRPYQGIVPSATAVAVTTGSPVPVELDVVIKQEDVRTEAQSIIVVRPVVTGTNVSPRGEDIAEGETLLPVGRVLRPQDLGVLASVGVTSVRVTRRPGVALLVTGNEILPMGARPTGFQIVDSNSVMLRSLIHRDGGTTEAPVYLPDDPAAIQDALLQCTADVIVVTGGTSVGTEDYACSVLSDIGELSVQGVRMRPGRPTGVGFLAGRPAFLVPGNPLACLCVYDLIVRLAVQRLSGQTWQLPYRRLSLKAGDSLRGAEGRWDYVRVCIRDNQAFPFRRGGGSGASVLSSASRAEGFVLLPPADTECPMNTSAEVYLYEP